MISLSNSKLPGKICPAASWKQLLWKAIVLVRSRVDKCSGYCSFLGGRLKRSLRSGKLICPMTKPTWSKTELRSTVRCLNDCYRRHYPTSLSHSDRPDSYRARLIRTGRYSRRGTGRDGVTPSTGQSPPMVSATSRLVGCERDA